METPACRGVAEDSKYPWGDREPTAKDAQFGARNPDAVCDERSPNCFGLCDMIGNVWNGLPAGTPQKYYEIAPDRNPQRSSEGMYRVVRAGSQRNHWVPVREESSGDRATAQ
jgi:formylglycine-generating enzyme required for sulfatase activity